MGRITTLLAFLLCFGFNAQAQFGFTEAAADRGISHTYYIAGVGGCGGCGNCGGCGCCPGCGGCGGGCCPGGCCPGNMSYIGGASLRDLVHHIPCNRLLVETDAPFLQPKTLPRSAGRRNEPAHLPLIVRFLADVLGQDEAELARQTRANAIALFDLPNR